MHRPLPNAKELRQGALLVRAQQALDQANTMDHIKQLRDKAEAVRQYAKTANLGLALQNQAAELKLRAQRKAGELLRQAKLRGGDRKSNNHRDCLNLKELGVSQNQSTRWQKEASLPKREFEDFVSQAHEHSRELTASSLHKLIKQFEAGSQIEEPSPAMSPAKTDKRPTIVATLEELVAGGHRFRTIYADPPWPYSNQRTRAATSNHYPTMTLDDLRAEPVRELSDEASHLHLWTTNAFLPDAFSVIEAWGFRYKSCFVWVKPQIGIGNYWRVSHEFLLFAVRGRLPFHDKTKRSWMEHPRTVHSRKPPIIRKLLESVSPGPYLEMYGREELPGGSWTVYGNQVERRLF